MLEIYMKKLAHGSDLPLPTYATAQSAGMDLMAAVTEDVVIKKGERKLIPTGVAIALPEGYEAQIRPRSGLAFKHGITVLNTPGTIDADYRGEIGIILINLGAEDFVVTRGMRVAQVIIGSYTQAKFTAVEDLSVTKRGDGGFGSTGKHWVNIR